MDPIYVTIEKTLYTRLNIDAEKFVAYFKNEGQEVSQDDYMDFIHDKIHEVGPDEFTYFSPDDDGVTIAEPTDVEYNVEVDSA